jgi:hypothetical protein
VSAVKQGAYVVFHIANGGGDHEVTKSSDPNGLNPSGHLVAEDGTFRDELHPESGITYYRID